MKTKQLNHYVEQGSAPVFGYPPICYSPKTESEQQQEQQQTTKLPKKYLSTFMKHVFTRNNALASVEDLIEAKKEEDDLQTAL